MRLPHRLLRAWLASLCVMGSAAAQTMGPPLPEYRGNTPVMPGSRPSVEQAVGQSFPAPGETTMNPLSLLEAAGRALPGSTTAAPTASGDAPLAALSTPVTILILLTVISLAPAIVLMTTCFPRILIVLGLLKQAIGAQGIPPPQVLTALALFMTMLVMAPTYDRVYREAIVPFRQGEIRDAETLWLKARQPVRDFMFDQIEATGNWGSLYTVLEYRGIDTSEPEKLTRADVDMVSLVPAFMLSELKAAFLLGFRIYLPFLVIDMVISSLLISMSMMMLPPVLISLPFKLLLFVMVDGWQLVVGGLLRGFVAGSPLTS
ncbi:MAG TPA: flagellar type III secretion system pore protein FliP [Phycisphaerales bacterium]